MKAGFLQAIWFGWNAGYCPLREGNLALLEQFDKFFAQPEVVTVQLDARVFNLATELRAQYRLKTPDALHLAAAISSECDEFWSNDDRLAKIAGSQIEVGNLINPLTTCQNHDPPRHPRPPGLRPGRTQPAPGA